MVGLGRGFGGKSVSRVHSLWLPLLSTNGKVTLKTPVGEESTVAIRTRYLSLAFFPAVNAPFWGPHSVGAATLARQALYGSKGENRRGGRGDTMPSLSFTHACLPRTTSEITVQVYPVKPCQRQPLKKITAHGDVHIQGSALCLNSHTLLKLK